MATLLASRPEAGGVSAMAPASDARFASIWVKQGGPAVQARHNQTLQEVLQTSQDMLSTGFRPISVRLCLPEHGPSCDHCAPGASLGDGRWLIRITAARR
ncbi:hypothetical protein [Streptomyces sp. NPDC090798]|uniref:hypothetical protein n=1 Tax=Streptomyces sp. NPDC090798 TaxID=3365968 RepID=UPI0037F5EF98